MTTPHKTCTKCGETKPLAEFRKDARKRDGHRSQCKTCIRGQDRRYHEENREEIAARKRRYREENREEIAARKRRYHEENREEIAARKRRYREENREEIAARRRRHYKENREEISEMQRRYHEENREEITARKRRYYKKYREEINEMQRQEEVAKQSLTASLATVPPRTPWLPGEDALLMADNGMTVYQKAIELGRTHKSCKDRRCRLLKKANQ